MAWVYILESGDGKHYVGSTLNVKQRLQRHNAGTGARTTQGRIWSIVYIAEYPTLTQARDEERRIKSFKGGNAFKKLVQHVD